MYLILKSVLSNYKASLICHLIFLLGVGPWVFLFDKTQSLVWINQHHNPVSDHLLYHLTRLPELSLIVFIIVLAFFYERKITLSVLTSLFLCGISIYLFKHVLFSDFERPSVWIKAHQIKMHLLQSIDLHSHGSFPSGHTLGAFATLGMAGMVSKNAWVQILFFILACGIAYSRVYVCQHYLRDVYVGALYGYGVCLLLFIIFNRLSSPYWNSLPFSKQS